MTNDIGIVGLGAMGVAAAWSLAQRGQDVIGFDRYGPDHAFGSSHGKTRIIRSVYFEGRMYAPLIAAAYKAWHSIKTDYGRAFFRKTGGLDISLRTGGVFEEALDAALAAQASFEVIEGLDLEARFPVLDLGGCGRAVYAPDSGLLDSDDATDWMRDMAERRGARLHFHCAVRGWRKTSRGFELDTADGTFTVRKLIVAAGPWTGTLFPELDHVLTPERQVVGWYRAEGPGYGSLPIFQLETETAERYYAFPPHKGYGLKLGLYHHRRERGEAAIRSRGVDDEDRRLLEAGLDLCLPGVGRDPTELVECRFTLAPDNRFLMGKWPFDEDIVVLSPCSGHGYKFTPVIGDIAAALALDEQPPVDIAEFSWKRVV